MFAFLLQRSNRKNISRLHPQNALGICNFADTLSCCALVQAAEKYIHHHFAEVSVTVEYLNLSFQIVADLISSDQLHVASEETVSP
jgi:kelch-like protein 18